MQDWGLLQHMSQLVCDQTLAGSRFRFELAGSKEDIRPVRECARTESVGCTLSDSVGVHSNI